MEHREKHDVGSLAVAEVFGIRVAVAERIGDEHGGLASQLKTLAALKTRDQVVETHHVRTGLSKALLILLVRAARQLFLLETDFPADRKFKFAAAARAEQLDLLGLFAFGVKSLVIHGYDAGTGTASSIVTNSRPRSRQRGSQCPRAA